MISADWESPLVFRDNTAKNFTSRAVNSNESQGIGCSGSQLVGSVRNVFQLSQEEMNLKRNIKNSIFPPDSTSDCTESSDDDEDVAVAEYESEEKKKSLEIAASRRIIEGKYYTSHVDMLQKFKGLTLSESFDRIVLGKEADVNFNSVKPQSTNPKKMSLKQVANAQYRKRLANRREIEKDATLLFLSNR